MTYRTKLMTLLLGLVVLINGLLAVATYRRSGSLLEKEFHRKARSIVSTAAALLDPRLVGAIRNAGDEKKPEYTTLRTQLRKIRDFNRREDVWLADIFTLVPARQDSKYVEYGVDAEDRFAYEHHVGDVYLRVVSHSQSVLRESLGWREISRAFRRVSKLRSRQFATIRASLSRCSAFA